MREPDADLWDWAVAAYRRPGVAELCLALQDDHGQCVPLLLWAAWPRSDLGRADAAAAISRVWSDTVIEPLRQVRRRLKLTISDDDEALRLPLREKVKAVELSAEKALLDRLSGLRGTGTADALDRLGAAVAAWAGPAPAEKLSALAAALSEA